MATVDVPGWLWAATVGGLVLVIAFDLWWVDRRDHPFTTREATHWVVFYVLLALGFGGLVWTMFGATYAGQFLAGYLTEYSLSVDNLFVFLVIMSSFAVPAAYQHRVLLVGIVIALLLRGRDDRAGRCGDRNGSPPRSTSSGRSCCGRPGTCSATAGGEPNPQGNAFVRFVERWLPTTRQYHGTALTAVVDGRRVVTPMLLVMVAIGTTDVLFALDSIPAVFGLTTEPFLVFTANAFALMGLRQLFFLLHGLLDRLVYLHVGLAVILAFIGVKLVLEAVHLTTSPAGPDRRHRRCPWPSSSTSLAVTAVASLVAVRRNPALAERTCGGAGGGGGGAGRRPRTWPRCATCAEGDDPLLPPGDGTPRSRRGERADSVADGHVRRPRSPDRERHADRVDPHDPGDPGAGRHGLLHREPHAPRGALPRGDAVVGLLRRGRDRLRHRGVARRRRRVRGRSTSRPTWSRRASASTTSSSS